jgi:hypothetical protein
VLCRVKINLRLWDYCNDGITRVWSLKWTVNMTLAKGHHTETWSTARNFIYFIFTSTASEGWWLTAQESLHVRNSGSGSAELKPLSRKLTPADAISRDPSTTSGWLHSLTVNNRTWRWSEGDNRCPRWRWWPARTADSPLEGRGRVFWLSHPLLQFSMWRYWFHLSRYVCGGNIAGPSLLY